MSFNGLCLRTGLHHLLRTQPPGKRPYKVHFPPGSKEELQRFKGINREQLIRNLHASAIAPKIIPQDVPMENYVPAEPAPSEHTYIPAPKVDSFGEAFVKLFDSQRLAGDIVHVMSGELLYAANRKVTKMFAKRFTRVFDSATNIESTPKVTDYITCDNPETAKSVASLWDTYVEHHKASLVMAVRAETKPRSKRK